MDSHTSNTNWKLIEDEVQFTVLKQIHSIQHCPYCNADITYWVRIQSDGIGRVCATCGSLYQWQGRQTVDDGWKR